MADGTTTPTTADPIDVAAGLKLRARRRMLGLTQTALGEAAGVTFQQVQKYETGRNRISLSTLVRFSRALDCTPATLIPQLDPTGGQAEAQPAADPLAALYAARGGPALARLFPALSPRDQAVALATVVALAGEDRP